MQRRPTDLRDQRFDLVVLGGGVLGASVARDAALRGLAVALLEREDFAAGTSSNSLKVVHGGLRHLQHLDLHGMRESVRERSNWLRLAPHLVEPLPVVVPLFGGPIERNAFRLALWINDRLSYDRNRGLPRERQIRPGRTLSPGELAELAGPLCPPRATGGVAFHDAQMYSSERLVLAVVTAASESGAVVVNHASCVGPLLQDGRRIGVRAIDHLDEKEIPVRARVIVNASGPAADGLTRRLTGRAPTSPPSLSLAWNLVLPDLGARAAVALPGSGSTPTGSGGRGPRRLFAVPWRGRTLLGTGHAPYRDDPASFEGLDLDHPAISSFLEELRMGWPNSEITPEDVRLVHAGLLPAESPAGGADEVRLRRRPTLEETDEGGSPVITARSVKFTTSRRLAETAVDRACRHLGHDRRGLKGRSTPLPGAPQDGVASLLRSARGEHSPRLPDDVLEHLIRSYGSRYLEVLELRREDPRWDERVIEGRPVIRAQLLHAVHSEMACTVEDLLYRRTELGSRGPVADAVRAEVESILAASDVQRSSSP